MKTDASLVERLFHGIVAAGMLATWIVPSPLGESVALAATEAIAVEVVFLVISTFMLMSFMLPAGIFRVLNLACGATLLAGFLIAYYWPFDSGWNLLVAAVLFLDHAWASYRPEDPRRNSALLVERSYRVFLFVLIAMVGHSVPLPALGLAELTANLDDPDAIPPHRVVGLAFAYFTILTLLPPRLTSTFVRGGEFG